MIKTNKKNNIRDIVSKEYCTGCSACYSSCPANCIEMEEDEEGFLYPKVDLSKCINCGLCIKNCPINHSNFNMPRNLYASIANDDEIRRCSSSGGISYILAKSILEEGGVVYGVVMKNFKVFHKAITKVSELFEIQSTKYVQSNLLNSFREIKSYLSSKKVLFIGTPCQVAGLKSFIKDNKNLICIDLVCHGVPSPGVFDKYVRELREKFYSAEKLYFRDKIYGWKKFHAISLYNHDNKLIFREPGQYNVFIRAFLSNMINRKSCSSCKFSQIKRVGDLTLGDFWGIEHINKSYDDGKGISLVYVNTEIGAQLYRKIIPFLKLSDNFDIKTPTLYQKNLKSPSPRSSKRNDFFNYYKHNNHVIAYLSKKVYNIGILNFHFANNYGAVLVPYSLLKILQKLGYQGEIINYIPVNVTQHYPFKYFRDKYLTPISAVLKTRKELINISRWWKYVIVGSDQVWRMFDTGIYMLDWVSGLTNIISYGASFGNDFYCGSISSKTAKALLNRFNSISVREKSGIRVCNEIFDVEAVHVLDPTMLLDQDDYNELIQIEKNNFNFVDNHDYIAYSFINSRKHVDIIKSGKAMIEFNGYEFVNCLWVGNDFRHVAEWINIIKNAKYIITDSFHAVVFSIIFNKEFVAIVPDDSRNGNDRIKSLLNTFGISLNRIKKSVCDVYLDTFNEKIDYSNVNRLIKVKQKQSIDFIKISLETEINDKGSFIQIA